MLATTTPPSSEPTECPPLCDLDNISRDDDSMYWPMDICCDGAAATENEL